MTTICCFFIGHRDAPEELFPALAREVERHITEFGVREFIVGRRGRFDEMAARAVSDAKKRHPEVALTLLLAYHPADRPPHLPACFDGSVYPDELSGVPKRCAIVRANQWAADRCTHLIAYAWQPGSNSRRLVEYAQRRGNPLPVHVTLLSKVRHVPAGS